MNRKNGFDLYAISESRAHLMGLATVWVALFHSYSLDFFQSPTLSRLHLIGLMNRLRETGNCGVDLFLFLSGLGLCFSMALLRDTEKRPVRAFYRRRFSKILPTVLAVSLITYGIKETRDFSDWLGKTFLFGCFRPAQEETGYWFFALLILLYLAYPAVDLCLRRWHGAGAAGMILLAIAGGAVLKLAAPAYFEHIEILVTRIPVFLIGAYAGTLCRRHISIPRALPMACIPLAFAGIFLIPAIPFPGIWLRRYAYGLWTVVIVLGHAGLWSLIKRKGACYRLTCMIGSFSMEMYLIYENLYVAEPRIFHQADPAGLTYAGCVFTASLLLAALLRSAITVLRREYQKPVDPADK